MSEVESAALDTRVYIDGYNFYYGCLKGTAYKWLDPIKLFEQYILPSILTTRVPKLVAKPSIKFFTADIKESVARSSDSVSSQAKYHTALQKLYKERIEIIKGYYAVNKMKIPIINEKHPARKPNECEQFQAWKVEEKKSDVNLALHAYHDSITNEIEQAVFVTNDTDIAPALQMIRDNTNTRVGLVIPTISSRIPNRDLTKLAHWVRKHVNADELAASQLPRVIQSRKPTIKPESWYADPAVFKEIMTLSIPIQGSRSKVYQWMNKPNTYLNAARPIDLVDTKEGSTQVLAYVQNWIASKSSK